MSNIAWDLRIDWNNDGTFSAGTATATTATAAGNAITNNYLVTPDASATGFAIGDKVMIYNSGGVTLKQDYLFTVTSKVSASGFTNIFVTPDFAVATATNDVLKKVTPTGEFLTERSLDDSPVHLQYGRDVARAQSPVSPGEATFALNNSSKDYSPNNGSSPITGNLLPGRPCLLRGTLGATTYTLFRGFLDNYEPDADLQQVSFTAVDVLSRLRGVNITTDLKTGIRGGEAIGYILDAIGWTGGRDLDSGGTIFPYWWAENEDAYEALQKVIQSEGPPAIAYVDENGGFVFRDRHHRLVRTASKTSQATFKDSGADSAGSVVFQGFRFDAGWRDVVNSVTFSADERAATSDRVVVWEDESVINFSASEVIDVPVQVDDPFFNAATPVDGNDFTTITGTVTASLSQTSGQSTIITLTAGAGVARIDGLRLRAVSVPVTRTRQATTTDATSIGRYGPRSWPDPFPWGGIHDAKNVSALIVNLRKDKREIITTQFTGGNNDTVTTQQLGRDLSDLVTITETQTVTNSTYYIERIEHDIGEAGARVETTFSCERAPTTLDNPSTVFVIGTSSLGTGVLGR